MTNNDLRGIKAQLNGLLAERHGLMAQGKAVPADLEAHISSLQLSIQIIDGRDIVENQLQEAARAEKRQMWWTLGLVLAGGCGALIWAFL
jgi:hypothetical protein